MNYGQHSIPQPQDDPHIPQPLHNYSSYYMYQRPSQHLTSLQQLQQQQSHIMALHPLVHPLAQVLPLSLSQSQGQSQSQPLPVTLSQNHTLNQSQLHPQSLSHSHPLLHAQPQHQPHTMAQPQLQSQPQSQSKSSLPQPHTLSLSQPMHQQLAQYIPLEYYSRVNPSYNYSMYAAPYTPSDPASLQSIPSSLPNTSTFTSAPSSMASVTQNSSLSSYTSAAGQFQPPGLRPRVTTTMWEDEKTLCYQVDANSVSVVRRADNDMINGTKLLNVARMTRGRRDGILKLEKLRHVVKIGLMHLKGVWIPFDRALQMAQREGIVDLLYPLFVRDIKRVIQTGVTPAAVAAVTQAPPPPPSVMNMGELPVPQSPSAPSSARHLLSSVSNRHLVSSATAGTMQNLYRLYSLDSQQQQQLQLQQLLHPSKYQSLAHSQPQTQPQPPIQTRQPLYGSLNQDQPRPQALPQHYSAQQYYMAPQGMNLYYQMPYLQNAQYSSYNAQPAYSGYPLSQQPQAQALGQPQTQPLAQAQAQAQASQLSIPHQSQILPMDSQPPAPPTHQQNPQQYSQSASTENVQGDLSLTQNPHSFASRNLGLDHISNPRSHLSLNLSQDHHLHQQQQRSLLSSSHHSSSILDKPQLLSETKLPLGLSEKKELM